MMRKLLEVERLNAVGACASPGNVSGDPHVCGQRCESVTGGGNGNGSVIDAWQWSVSQVCAHVNGAS